MIAGEAAAGTDVRAVVRELWASILITEEPADEANFYEEGGDSLLAFTLSREIADRLGVTISPLIFMNADKFSEIIEAVIRESGFDELKS